MTGSMILIVEDDTMIAELLAYNLKEAGFIPRTFRQGDALFQALDQDPDRTPDLFILDLMLPGMDGYEICAKLRERYADVWIPILILTARGSESDKVRGLETGADDYLVKPFGMRELVARVQALLRRQQKNQSLAGDQDPEMPGGSPGAIGQSEQQATPDSPGKPRQIQCRDLLLDDVRHRVFKGNQEIEMTNREYELLKYLMMNRGIAFSRDELLDRVWGFDYGGETRTVDVHIRQLRRKIEDSDTNPVLIETVRGYGYRFNDQVFEQTGQETTC
jgi:two-component system, OmpR family, alkaline phosphatase synthesis response regulator PhoP